MHAKTTWILLVLVLLLGGVGWWLTRAEEARGEELGRKLLPGYVTGAVQVLRIENLRRDHRVELTRASRGWRITDPIDYPAADGAVNRLLDDLAVAPAVAVPDVDPANVGLDVPVAILEVYEQADGLEPSWRIEVGKAALNQNVVYVRTEGRIWRTLRNLETAVDRPLHDWRNPRAIPSPVGFGAVAEIERWGTGPFRASLDADGWTLVEPYRAALDPGRVTTFTRGLLTTLRVVRFEAEDPDARHRFGLDEPTTAVRFTTATAQTTEVRFRASGGRWYCTHDDSPVVVEIDAFAAELIQMPVEELLDRRVLRLVHDDVRRVELESTRGTVVIEREGGGFVVSGPTANGATLERVPADDGEVHDLLAELSQAEIVFGADEPRASDGGAPPPSPSPAAGTAGRAVWVESRAGVRFGGTFGPSGDAVDSEPVTFQRPGEDVTGLVSAELAALVARPADVYVSHVLHSVAEEEALWIELARGDVTRRWTRDDVGRWTRDGRPGPDAEFELVVDRLRHVRADELLDDDVELVDPIHVRIQPRAGRRIQFRLGPVRPAGPTASGDAEVVAYVGPERAATVDPELVDALSEFVGD